MQPTGIDQKSVQQIQELIDGSDLFPGNSSSKLPLDFNFKDDTILITGAAGSIGSEVTSQLLGTRFKKLVLIDNAESPLYNLVKQLELDARENVEFVLIDIRDQEAMRWLFNTYAFTVIFHTAAYKHVPLMEENAYEAVRLNIFATKIIADLSMEYNVKKFVFISTDKAVKPINVMGMTKRIAESYLNYLNSYGKTNFKSARFGNVFGSSGSVVPIFLKQIHLGRPVSLTSYDTTRYFISKVKAGYLILKMAALDENDGCLFTFNMGNPIKIIDLAKILIKHVTGDNPHKIEIIGLRPGEKIHEDLFSENEHLELTKHTDILKVRPHHDYSEEKVSFNLLSTVNSEMKNTEVKAILEDCIYQLQNSPSLLFAI
ncbi:SDR family NAD(P)-dependent oxidoreductase [Seonamhaeicola sp.]|uniref:SDR family NAD(P)-dependent oxidoreductase n=1 Tax=Seonamhaeicola sp. TaxID=1912245 RepID=UPI00261571B6|nr:SDR family NAD(P)-dependent oxidoreductase [Seonamhaeicola sp.]